MLKGEHEIAEEGRVDPKNSNYYEEWQREKKPGKLLSGW